MYLIYPQSIVCTIFFNFFFYWFIYRRFIQIQISSIYIAMLFLTSCIHNLFNHRKRKMKIKTANYYIEMIWRYDLDMFVPHFWIMKLEKIKRLIFVSESNGNQIEKSIFCSHSFYLIEKTLPNYEWVNS